MGDELVVTSNRFHETTFLGDYTLVRGAKGDRAALARVPNELPGDPGDTARPHLEWAHGNGYTYQIGSSGTTATAVGALPRVVTILDPATGRWVTPNGVAGE